MPEKLSFPYLILFLFSRKIAMSTLAPCPECQADFTYESLGLLNCPSCGHAWSANAVDQAEELVQVKDANGHVLADGDSVTLVKDLKIKGSSAVVKVGCTALASSSRNHQKSAS